MTEEELPNLAFEMAVASKYRLRLGQALFAAAVLHFPAKTLGVGNPPFEFDPYYDDDKIVPFLRYLGVLQE